MLSLADALLGRRLGDLVRELRVSDEVSRALTHHEGPLGELLSLAEAVERNEVQKFEPELDRFGLGLDSLQELDNDSYEWLHGLQQSGDQAGAS
jgi:EAL and modified HD-GYP domain-containing signal transduction protein